MKELANKIGNRIIILRLEKGISQEQLAMRAEITRTYMGSIERGEKNISVAYLKKILDVLEIDFGTFFKNI